MGQQLPSVHVLVVEDSLDIRELLTTILEREGATVTAVSTAEQALGLLHKELRPDVLLSGLDMPNHDGVWLISRVRALASNLGGLTPAACLTGSADPETRARILRAGFQYHIAKPIDTARLLGVVAILALKP